MRLVTATPAPGVQKKNEVCRKLTRSYATASEKLRPTRRLFCKTNQPVDKSQHQKNCAQQDASYAISTLGGGRRGLPCQSVCQFLRSTIEKIRDRLRRPSTTRDRGSRDQGQCIFIKRANNRRQRQRKEKLEMNVEGIVDPSCTVY